MRYGRSDVDWDELVRQGKKFLEERAKLERLTSYSEMNTVLANRTGQPPFDFDEEVGRAAMGALLGDISLTALPEVGALLSSVTQYLNANEPGTGFFELARQRGLLSKQATADDRLAFWTKQLQEVYRHFRGEA